VHSNKSLEKLTKRLCFFSILLEFSICCNREKSTQAALKTGPPKHTFHDSHAQSPNLHPGIKQLGFLKRSSYLHKLGLLLTQASAQGITLQTASPFHFFAIPINKQKKIKSKFFSQLPQANSSSLVKA